MSWSVCVACSFPARLNGLLGADSVPGGADVVCLVPCSCIHTFGMKRNIDVAFLDSMGRVVRSITDMPPRRVAGNHKAVMVIERFSSTGGVWPIEGEKLVAAIASPDIVDPVRFDKLGELSSKARCSSSREAERAMELDLAGKPCQGSGIFTATTEKTGLAIVRERRSN